MIDIGRWRSFSVNPLDTMKKKFIMTLLCLFGAVGMAEAKSLVLNLQNGKKVYYLLGGETNPMMRFVDGKVTMEADEYSLGDIKSFYISETDDPSGIESVLKASDVHYKSNTFVINSSDIETVKVFGLNGMQVKADVQKHGDIITVDLNALGSGTYIIDVDGSSFKVMKK